MENRKRRVEDAKSEPTDEPETICICPKCRIPRENMALTSVRAKYSEFRVGVSCGHAFCQACWRTYLISRVKSGHARGIACLEKGCHALLQFVMNLLEGTPYEKQFQKKYMEYYYAIYPCPNPSCSKKEHRRNPHSSETTIYCWECRTGFCYVCGHFHPWVTCERYESYITAVKFSQAILICTVLLMIFTVYWWLSLKYEKIKLLICIMFVGDSNMDTCLSCEQKLFICS